MNTVRFSRFQLFLIKSDLLLRKREGSCEYFEGFALDVRKQHDCVHTVGNVDRNLV